MKPRATLIQMLLVFGLACVLGVVFNNASPLGLRERELPTWTNQSARMASSHSNVTQVLPPPRVPSNAPAVAASSAAPPGPSEIVIPNIFPPTNLPSPPAPAVAPPPPPPPIGNVTWPQAKEQMLDGRTVLVDARMANYYQAGHIPNAEPLPAVSPPGMFAAFVIKHPPPATPLIIYCGAEQCHLSQALATIMTTQHGYTNVKVLSGG